jgi:hypothetical protein
MTYEPTQIQPPPPSGGKKKAPRSWWIRVSRICFFAYVVGYAAGRDDGPVAVWIMSVAAGVGAGCAMHANRLKDPRAAGHLIIHALVIAVLLFAGIWILSEHWGLFTAHWRQFFLVG